MMTFKTTNWNKKNANFVNPYTNEKECLHCGVTLRGGNKYLCNMCMDKEKRGLLKEKPGESPVGLDDLVPCGGVYSVGTVSTTTNASTAFVTSSPEPNPPLPNDDFVVRDIESTFDIHGNLINSATLELHRDIRNDEINFFKNNSIKFTYTIENQDFSNTPWTVPSIPYNTITKVDIEW